MRLSKAFWIWGQFNKNDTKYLNELQNKILKEFNSPIFDVHLTLTGPYKEVDKYFFDKLRNYCKSKSGIALKLKNYDIQNQFFKSFYLSVLNSKELYNLRKEICQLNNCELDKIYDAHISLAYGNFSKIKKLNLIKKLPKIKDEIKIERISLVDVDEKINSWNVIESFIL